MRGPAYRIETQRLTLRCWNPEDAPEYGRVLEESREHLRPWLRVMLEEPASRATHVARLRQYRADFDSDRDFHYAVLAGSRLVGGAAVHPRGAYGTRELSYWLSAPETKKGFAREMVTALVEVAFQVDGATHLEAHCDPENHASAHLVAQLSFTKSPRPGEPRLNVRGELAPVDVWQLPRDTWKPRGPMVAYAAAGERIHPL